MDWGWIVVNGLCVAAGVSFAWTLYLCWGV